MGCTNERTSLEPIDLIIQSKMMALPVKNDELSQKFSEAETMLNEVEILRRTLIDKRETIFYKTGACCRKNPSLETSIQSLFWSLAMLSNGDIQRYQLYFNEGQEPYFSISNAPQEYLNIVSLIDEYIKALLGFQTTLPTTIKQMTEILNDFNTNYSQYKSKAVAGYNDTDSKYREILSVFDRNVMLIKTVERIKVLTIVNSIYETDITFIKKFGDLIGDSGYLNGINQIGAASKAKKYKELYDVCFYNINVGERWKESPEEAKKEMGEKVDIKLEMQKSNY